MNEKKLGNTILQPAFKSLHHKAHWQRIEHKFELGIFDINCCGSRFEWWLELKCAPCIPATGRLAIDFTLDQGRWGMARLNAGGNAAVLLHVETTRVLYLLHPGLQNQIANLPFAEVVRDYHSYDTLAPIRSFPGPEMLFLHLLEIARAGMPIFKDI